ncbi:MAG: VOC family protein [Pseudomonadota bacterium]
MNRAFTNILCADVKTSAWFYENMLGMTEHGDFGWFMLLGHPTMPGFELGLLDQSHDSVPGALAGLAPGIILTFVVADVAEYHDRAVQIGAQIIQAPVALPYGQTRLLLRDPAGTIIDISSPTR